MNQYKNKHTIYKASMLLGEAFDFNDPMNTFGSDLPDTEPTSDTPDETETTYDVDVANPVCPCCGVRLNIIDASEDDNEISDTDIKAMDPTLEPSATEENDDVYISIDDTFDDEDEEDEEEGSDEEDEEESDEDPDEDEGEKIEAF